MKPLKLLALSSLVALIGLSLASTANAEGWSLNSLSPFGSSDDEPESRPASRTTATDAGPSLWESIQRDMRRLNYRTKRFFSDTADALTPEWPRRPAPATNGWFGPKRKPSREEERSWFGGLFAPEEPRMPQSPQDFVGMDRPEM